MYMAGFYFVAFTQTNRADSHGGPRVGGAQGSVRKISRARIRAHAKFFIETPGAQGGGALETPGAQGPRGPGAQGPRGALEKFRARAPARAREIFHITPGAQGPGPTARFQFGRFRFHRFRLLGSL